ncbi:MAG: large subunit ribosomal protein L15 [Candidatus Berkelbacteria bacterium Licking1014_2]|uniref:50S ribosomal protein L15 n=1 Tax=Candidatus Berkelbacteria bacterium Licking1014_2 TaxID=2017146 RepID=A0A554LWX2_9BACT|nr:MAG: large subunit ribosomal protein L15 [Candidatus Berkelbacteria bacterium Licking1014_2]
MKLHELVRPPRKYKQRLGRGKAAGGGKTAGRGTKGQKSRSGHKFPRIKLNIPKVKGFTSRRVKPYVVNVDTLSRVFPDGAVVSPKELLNKGLIRDLSRPVKILSRGQLTKTLKFVDVLLSKKIKSE